MARYGLEWEVILERSTAHAFPSGIGVVGDEMWLFNNSRRKLWDKCWPN